jgi:hypothetical protein
MIRFRRPAMRFRVAAVSMLLPLLLRSPAVGQGIRGAFAELYCRPTREALTAAREDSLNLVIIQYVRNGRDSPDTSGLRQFIDTVDTAQMPYMIGLHYIENWDSRWQHGRSIRRYVQSNLNLYRQLKDSTTGEFKGWYMPLEVGNDTAGNDAELAAQFAGFREIPRQLLAMSVYFNPDVSEGMQNPTRFARRVGRIADLFGMIILQDGVGARHVTDPAVIRPYLQAVRDTVLAHGAKFWIDVEAFEGGEDKDLPSCETPDSAAAPERITWQVELAREFAVDVLGFDLGEYMCPVGEARRRRAAYEAFVAALVPGAPRRIRDQPQQQCATPR